jgi:Cu/Ag efflux pump CusA
MSKNHLIYNTAVAPTISQGEEKELQQKLENMINELERVITLSIPCGSEPDQKDKVMKLVQQTNRLKDCESLLNAEYEKIGKLLKYFEV